MVAVASHVSGLVVEQGRHNVGDDVIYAGSFSIFIPGAFYLICSSGSAPQKPIRKFAVFEVVVGGSRTVESQNEEHKANESLHNVNDSDFLT